MKKFFMFVLVMVCVGFSVPSMADELVKSGKAVRPDTIKVDSKFVMTDIVDTVFDMTGKNGDQNFVFQCDKGTESINVWYKLNGPDGTQVTDATAFRIVSVTKDRVGRQIDLFESDNPRRNLNDALNFMLHNSDGNYNFYIQFVKKVGKKYELVGSSYGFNGAVAYFWMSTRTQCDIKGGFTTMIPLK